MNEEKYIKGVAIKVGDKCRRESTDAGPDFCAHCSGLLQEWVEWEGHTRREAHLIASFAPRLRSWGEL